MVVNRAGEFQAIGDDGQKYTVLIFRHTLKQTDGTTTEAVELVTDEGLLVKRLARGQYMIVSTGVKLTSNEKAAP